MSEAQLAAFAEVSPAYVHRLECDEYKAPSHVRLERIAKVLHVHVNELTATKPPSPPAIDPRIQHLLEDLSTEATEDEIQSVLEYLEWRRTKWRARRDPDKPEKTG